MRPPAAAALRHHQGGAAGRLRRRHAASCSPRRAAPTSTCASTANGPSTSPARSAPVAGPQSPVRRQPGGDVRRRLARSSSPVTPSSPKTPTRAGPGASPTDKGADLYSYDVETDELTDLTVDQTSPTRKPGRGSSTSSAPAGTPPTSTSSPPASSLPGATSGARNIYVEHDGEIKFVATNPFGNFETGLSLLRDAERHIRRLHTNEAADRLRQRRARPRSTSTPTEGRSSAPPAGPTANRRRATPRSPTGRSAKTAAASSSRATTPSCRRRAAAGATSSSTRAAKSTCSRPGGGAAGASRRGQLLRRRRLRRHLRRTRRRATARSSPIYDARVGAHVPPHDRNAGARVKTAAGRVPPRSTDPDRRLGDLRGDRQGLGLRRRDRQGLEGAAPRRRAGQPAESDDLRPGPDAARRNRSPQPAR